MPEMEYHRFIEEKMLKKMQDCFSGEKESDHQLADAILCEALITMGMTRLVESFGEVNKWYA